jgi:membrane protease YdiL (CAAX protease family)
MKNNLNFNISLPKFKNVLKPIIIGIVLTIVINILMTIATKLVGGKIEEHPLLSKMNPIQVLIFVFIYASIVEEILFRGFLLNLLKPLKTSGITIFKRKISFSVIISALAFGLAHLILIKTGVDSSFLLRVVLFTTTLGLVAGYYQEKYDNNSYAIIVHMSGNSVALIGAFLISITA